MQCSSSSLAAARVHSAGATAADPCRLHTQELVRLRYSVLQVDTDTAWVHDPFPLLHTICGNFNATVRSRPMPRLA